MNEQITKDQAIAVLKEVREKIGRNYKQPIRMAWMNGDYTGEGLEQWDSQLQQIRNVFGPTWLVNIRV